MCRVHAGRDWIEASHAVDHAHAGSKYFFQSCSGPRQPPRVKWLLKLRFVKRNDDALKAANLPPQPPDGTVMRDGCEDPFVTSPDHTTASA